MIESIDSFLTRIYQKPLPLVVITLTATVFGFGLYAFAPEVDQASVFYWPLTRAHLIGQIMAVVGLTLGLVFYAQHNSPVRSLILFVIAGVLILGTMTFQLSGNNFRDIRHGTSINTGGQVYHLGKVNTADTEIGVVLDEYTLYECGLIGAFCDRVTAGLRPSTYQAGQSIFQHTAVLQVEDGVLRVLDGGTADVLYEHTP
jgi:hypothetical protein